MSKKANYTQLCRRRLNHLIKRHLEIHRARAGQEQDARKRVVYLALVMIFPSRAGISLRSLAVSIDIVIIDKHSSYIYLDPL